VTLTSNAAAEIKRQLVALGSQSARVRIGLAEGGCAGTKYVVTPGAAKEHGDLETEQCGLSVICDPVSLAQFEGLQVDFVKALMGGGFKFDNPRAAGSCGCGASFRSDPAQVGNMAR